MRKNNYAIVAVPVSVSFFHSSSHQQPDNRCALCIKSFCILCGKKINHREHGGIQHKHREHFTHSWCSRSTSFFHGTSQQQLLPADRQGKFEMRLFILYNLQLEIINFLNKNLRKAACYASV